LGTNTHNARLVGSEESGGATVRGDLLKEIADRTNLQLLGDELRRTPIDVPVDAVLVAGARIEKVVGAQMG
jgi:hypothetical protein